MQKNEFYRYVIFVNHIYASNMKVGNGMPGSVYEKDEKFNFAKYLCTIFLNNSLERLSLSFP